MKKIINVVVERTKDNRYEVICIDPDWLLVKEKRKDITDALVCLWYRIVWDRIGYNIDNAILHIVNAEEFTKEIEEAQENKYLAMSRVMSRVIDN